MKIDTELLEELCEIQSVTHDMDEMKYFLWNYFEESGTELDMDNEGNMYINRSLKNVPCMVAHMDTVHSITDNITVFKAAGIWTGINTKTMKATGIGGDDKVGIYITLEMLKRHQIKAAFFVDEEIGCAGSFSADMTFFKDCQYVLQCDRRGKDDFITNISGKLSSDKFQADVRPIISKYGYKFGDGMITDVGQLAENKIGISVANMSCGYYNPHCANEYIVLSDVLNCMQMCNEIFATLKNRYKHKYKYSFNWPTKYTPLGKDKGNWNSWDAAGADWDDILADKDKLNSKVKKEGFKDFNEYLDHLDEADKKEIEKREFEDLLFEHDIVQGYSGILYDMNGREIKDLKAYIAKNKGQNSRIKEKEYKYGDPAIAHWKF